MSLEPSFSQGMTPILPERLNWSSAIGLFIINYGVLDLLVQDFLETTVSPEDFSRIRERPFGDRIERIKQHVGETSYPVEKRQQFDDFFRHLDPVRNLRNHIAHGV